MKKIRPYLGKIIYFLPGAKSLWIRLRKILCSGRIPDFSGWGMETNTFTPWYNGGGDDIARGFLKANQEINNKVRRGEFNLSQFDKIQDKKQQLAELMWRHYIVFWSAHFASKKTNYFVQNIVECGVCDGLSVYFAMNALKRKNHFKAFLYDSWEGLKTEYSLESEKNPVDDYSHLSIENTIKNLATFKEQTIFNKGFIPESFEKSNNPDEIVWLHIDLNSAIPTKGALHFFFKRILPGGLILFDDYAWHDYYDTKLAIDEFLQGKEGVLLPLPTGQAIYFKH